MFVQKQTDFVVNGSENFIARKGLTAPLHKSDGGFLCLDGLSAIEGIACS